MVVIQNFVYAISKYLIDFSISNMSAVSLRIIAYMSLLFLLNMSKGSKPSDWASLEHCFQNSQIEDVPLNIKSKSQGTSCFLHSIENGNPKFNGGTISDITLSSFSQCNAPLIGVRLNSCPDHSVKSLATFLSNSEPFCLLLIGNKHTTFPITQNTYLINFR